MGNIFESKIFWTEMGNDRIFKKIFSIELLIGSPLERKKNYERINARSKNLYISMRNRNFKLIVNGGNDMNNLKLIGIRLVSEKIYAREQ